MTVNSVTPGGLTALSGPAAGKVKGGSIHEIALDLHAKRLQLIASNIANADTPNYKAVEIDFDSTLRQAIKTLDGQAPKSPLSNAQGPATADYVLQYHTPVQRSADGNTVDLDLERSKFADAAIRYQFALDRVSGHYKDMEKLLNNLPY